jgi:Mrp family chromosome partitioning ATPase
LNELTPDLRAYVRPIIDRWWLVVLVVAFVTAAAYVYYSSSETKTYRATTTLLARSSPLESALLGEQPSQVDTGELAALIESRATAEAVHRRLRGEDISGSIDAQAIEDTNVSTPTRLMTVTATANSASGAARLANIYATTFASLTSSRSRGQVSAARQRDERELAALGRSPADQQRRRELTRDIRRLSAIERLPAASVEQIDPALSGARLASQRERKTLFAFAVSLMIAVAAAYLLAWLDGRVRRTEDVERLYRLSLLGALPHDPAKRSRGEAHPAPSREMRTAVRSMRVNLELAGDGSTPGTILVTSASSEEGRSTVVRNLALAYHEAGRRVAVVEADLREPRLAEWFIVRGAPGLREVLRGDQELDTALQPVPVATEEGAAAPAGGNGSHTSEATGSLTLLTGGDPGGPPANPISPARMRSLLERIATEYDVVIVDSPPLLPLSDAVHLLSAVDGVLVVARIGHVTRANAAQVPDVLARLKGVHPLGVVANDVATSSFQRG